MVVVEEILEHEGTIAERAEQVKKLGNEHFGNGEWQKAAEKYQEALSLCPIEDDRLQPLRAVLLSNLAAVHIKLEAWNDAAEAATKAIELDAPNEKALERRAFAYFHISDKFEAALEDYEQLSKQFPDRPAYRIKMAELKQKIDARNEAMKEEVMSKLKGLGNMILKPFGLSTDSFELKPNETGGYSIQMRQQTASQTSEATPSQSQIGENGVVEEKEQEENENERNTSGA